MNQTRSINLIRGIGVDGGIADPGTIIDYLLILRSVVHVVVSLPR